MVEYIIGNVVRCSTQFTNLAGTAIDPTTVAFSFRTPSGSTTNYTYGVDGALVRTGTGAYYVDVDANAEGMWSYRFSSTGTGKAADEGSFAVVDSVFF